MPAKTNSVIKIVCGVCDTVKNKEIDACIAAVIERICGGHPTGVYRCSKECQTVYDINPLAYERAGFNLKEHLVELTAMKCGLKYKAQQ